MAKWLKNGKSEKEIVEADAEVRKTVEKILQDVAKRGDEAVRELSIKFDNYSPDNFILSKEEIDSRVNTALKQVEIDHRAKHKPNQLSGGQQQMLAIGRGLMLRPKLMLLDEPSLGLSPKLVSEISEIILRLNKEQGVTILLVEQNAKMALDIGDYGFVMELGRIVMEDSCSRLKASTDIQEFYLGMKDEGVRGRRRWKQRKTWR